MWRRVNLRGKKLRLPWFSDVGKFQATKTPPTAGFLKDDPENQHSSSLLWPEGFGGKPANQKLNYSFLLLDFELRFAWLAFESRFTWSLLLRTLQKWLVSPKWLVMDQYLYFKGQKESPREPRNIGTSGELGRGIRSISPRERDRGASERPTL